MGKLKYIWVTLLPLAWDAAVTLTASYQKIFSADPKIGFFAQRSAFQEALNNGEVLPPATSAAEMQKVITNSTVDGVLSILFAALIIIIIADAARVWFGIIRGRQEPTMSEAPYEESHLDVEGNILEPVGAGTGGSGRDA
jgi:carbon starvation protein